MSPKNVADRACRSDHARGWSCSTIKPLRAFVHRGLAVPASREEGIASTASEGPPRMAANRRVCGFVRDRIHGVCIRRPIATSECRVARSPARFTGCMRSDGRRIPTHPMLDLPSPDAQRSNGAHDSEDRRILVGARHRKRVLDIPCLVRSVGGASRRRGRMGATVDRLPLCDWVRRSACAVGLRELRPHFALQIVVSIHPCRCARRGPNAWLPCTARAKCQRRTGARGGSNVDRLISMNGRMGGNNGSSA